MNFVCFKRSVSAISSSFTWSVILGLTLSSIFTVPALAQRTSAMSAVYGRGVHAYFAGNSALAEQYFTQVIQSGSNDPRPYYFRGVLRLGMGRQHEAEMDMRIGASFEANNPGIQGTIGRSLQRVQGPSRRTLEKYRRQARLDRVQQGLQQTQQRYEHLQRRGPTVLRNPATLSLDQPVQPPQGAGAAPPPQLQAPTMVRPQPEVVTTPQPGLAEVEEADNVFETPAPVTPQDDPFGSAPAPDTTPGPVAEDPQPETSEDDLFGAETAAPAADSDPFGAAIDQAEEMPEDSSAEPAAGDEADPFGGSTDPADDSDPFSDSPDAEAESDPFGDGGESSDAEDSAESSDDEDPFGDSSTTTDDSDPFGEEMEESESTEGDSAPADQDSEPATDDDDPFGPFGATSPESADAFAENPGAGADANPAMSSPAGQFFFQLGHWLGSQTNQAGGRGPQMAPAPAADGVLQADFELGPTEENRATTATSAQTLADDPFADPEEAGAPATKTEKPAEDFDDPFGDF